MPTTFERMLQAESGNRQHDSNGRVIRSPVGAVGIAQIMPATGPEAARDAGLPWDPVRFENDADYNRTLGEAYYNKLVRMFDGNERMGAAAYNAGPGAVRSLIRRHGAGWERRLPAETQTYLRRVTGNAVAGAGQAPAPQYTPVPEVHIPTAQELLFGNPLEGIGETEDALRAAENTRPQVASSEDLMRAALHGDGSTMPGTFDTSRLTTEATREAELVEEEDWRNSQGHWDRFTAAFDETLTANFLDMLDNDINEFDPEFMRTYGDNWQSIESFAQDDAEVEMIREATSQSHLAQIQQDILDRRERNRIIETASSPTALRLGVGILDPVGWVAGYGVGKGFQLAGVGSRALAVAGRPGAAIASAAGEGMIGNVGLTAMLDDMGEYVAPGDYALSALTGLSIGVLGGALTNYTSRDAIALQDVNNARAAAAQRTAEIREEVTAELGPNATPEQVSAGVHQRHVQDVRDTLEFALADIPEDQRLLVSEEILTQNEQFKQAIVDANDLDSLADMTEQALVAEATARAERIAAANPVDQAALRGVTDVLARVGQEATSTRLLRSDSVVARSVAITLLENPQGAAGRQRSAAITAAVRERLYVQQLAGFDNEATLFRRQQGVGQVREAFNGNSGREFNRRVVLEIERRGGGNYTPDNSPHVVRAADRFEQGMDLMRQEQQRVGTVGAARLGTDSIGYIQHRIDPRKLAWLHKPENRSALQKVRSELSGQFQAYNDFDKEFSDTLAAKYLERGLDAGQGRYHVPMNMASGEAAEMVTDALRAMNLPDEELARIMGKFSRGGASHTKKRLKLDLTADLGGGMQLVDLFVTDVPQLYRAYARRVAGEVALAQYGVMGKKGLDVLRKAASATGATAQDLQAFDQVAAEFLNTPYGTGHYMADNLRLLTSAARLGNMGFTQFAEFGNAIPALGVKAALKGVASLPRIMGEVRALSRGTGRRNPILGSLEDMGGHFGMEDYYATRMFDVPDNDIELYNGNSLGVFSRAVRSAAHANMVMSGHRIILASQTRSMAEQIIRKAIRYAREGTNTTDLKDMGFTDEVLAKLRKDMDLVAEFDGKGNLGKLDLFKGKALTPADVAEIAQAVERGASQIIQRTYHGETGAWAHSGFLKILLQFRTFSMTAIEKQWGRNVKKAGGGGLGALRSFMTLMAAASFAAPIHLARVQTRMLAMDSAKAEEYWENNANILALARATMNYASAAGLTGDIMDLGVGFASNHSEEFAEQFGDPMGVRGKRSDQLIPGVLAPSAGLANDAWSSLYNLNGERALRSLPGSNLPYVSPFITAALAD